MLVQKKNPEMTSPFQTDPIIVGQAVYCTEFIFCLRDIFLPCYLCYQRINADLMFIHDIYFIFCVTVFIDLTFVFEKVFFYKLRDAFVLSILLYSPYRFPSLR